MVARFSGACHLRGGGGEMSLILSIPIAMLFVIGGMKLNVSNDYLLCAMAIIFEGGLAGCKD